MNKLKSLYTAAIERPIYEKILFFVCLFSVIGTMIYYICAVPYIGNTETFMNFLYAKECIRAKELLSTEFIYRNDINYIPLNLLYIIPALISDSNAFCCIFIGAVMVFAGSAAVIYCSRKVSGNNCWLIYLPILWCGFCAGYIRQHRTKTFFWILHTSCLHIFRDIAQFVLARRVSPSGGGGAKRQRG